jgi:DNA polymerase zeta
MIQIKPPTQDNPFGFKFDFSGSIPEKEDNELVILSVEVHVQTRPSLLPDPNIDPVCAIFYCLQNGGLTYKRNGFQSNYHVGIIMQNTDYSTKTGINGYPIEAVDNEECMILKLCEIVQTFDPDILCGFEIQKLSWGYLDERASKYGINLLQKISRIADDPLRKRNEYNSRKSTHLETSGRIFLNIWRNLRKQVDLTLYTLENLVFHVLHKRIPRFSHTQLTEWFGYGLLMRWRCLKYYIDNVQYNLELLEKTQFLVQTVEFAKIYGIDFNMVITRGSQYRVESVMGRVTRIENYMLPSPSPKQVSEMEALESMPLNMEPDTRFYSSPMIVLDFQSLYPSIMISHNYCYSTLIGRVDRDCSPFKFSRACRIKSETVEKLRDSITVSRNGVAFIKSHVKQGVIGRMLTELLETRVMLKNSMKRYKASNHRLFAILDAKQQSLKLLANVVYGYTSATFSGRMPAVEIADSVVETGRMKLEESIRHVNQDYRVVYADTDSLFVYTPSKTLAQAFSIGHGIAKSITEMNPKPMKLNFEKVYHPCVLLAKKRYVGFKYEHINQKEPVFDAKGIETVRRDGCGAVSKTMENSLKILFRTKDLSQVKDYLKSIWSDILSGNVNLSDFIISKEVHMGDYSRNGTLPPGAQLSKRKMMTDPRAAPEHNERVPYVVIHQEPGHRLIDAIVDPLELIEDDKLFLHGTYYIEKQINPALDRVFRLVGADINQWFKALPKTAKARIYQGEKGKTIDSFYSSSSCICCSERSVDQFCTTCFQNKNKTRLALYRKCVVWEERFAIVQMICQSCTGHYMIDANSSCQSLACPVFFTRRKALNHVRQISKITRALESL